MSFKPVKITLAWRCEDGKIFSDELSALKYQAELDLETMLCSNLDVQDLCAWLIDNREVVINYLKYF